MSTTQFHLPPAITGFGKKTAYAIAVAVNLAALVVVLNILEWGFLPWLTDDFTTVVPWISFSLIASIVANLVYEVNDAAAVKSTGQIAVNLITIVVTSQVLRVFPFDFSSYGFDWAIVARIVLILAIVGAGIGVITETSKLASAQAEKRKEVRRVDNV